MNLINPGNLFKVATFVIATSFIVSPVINAGEAEDKGLAISKEAKDRDYGWKNSQADMQMLLRNQYGESSSRQMSIKSMEQENDGDKSLTVFNSPNDVKGTAFLSFSHPTSNDEQWLYLPALKRVKRISSRNKSGSFMGSEFSFEDLTSFEIEKYSYKYLKDEIIDGLDCWVIENYPKDKYSGYKRRIVWIDKTEYRTLKTEFYDRKNTLLKTLTMSEHKKYLDKFWRASKLEMVNHQSGKSTLLSWENYRFQTDLNEKDFSKNALKRAR